MQILDVAGGSTILKTFDTWSSANTTPLEIESVDILMATEFVRRFDLKLRLPDAIHIATALRVGAPH
jgi:predicted nucleic acid-binding protein